jgi:hypothetical protein
MRTFVVVAAVAALAAAPCAWDTGPGEPPPITAILAGHAGLSAPASHLVSGALSDDRPRTAPIENLKGGDREAL